MISTLLLALPLLLSPGPSYLVSFTFAARYGLGNILVFLLGIITVYAIVSVVIGVLMVEMVFQLSSSIDIIQIIGGAYIIYLAIGLLRRKQYNNSSSTKPGFLNGVIIQILNSKYPAVVVIIFTNSPELPMLMTAAIITSLSICGLLAYSYAGSIIHNMLFTEKSLRIIDIIFSMLLCLVGVWMMLSILVKYYVV